MFFPHITLPPEKIDKIKNRNNTNETNRQYMLVCMSIKGEKQNKEGGNFRVEHGLK